MEVATRSGQARADGGHPWALVAHSNHGKMVSIWERTRPVLLATWLYCIAADRIVRLPMALSNKSFVLVSVKKKHNRGCFLTSRNRIANGIVVLSRLRWRNFSRLLFRVSFDPRLEAPFEFGAEMELAKVELQTGRELQRAILIPSYDWDSSRSLRRSPHSDSRSSAIVRTS